LEAQRSEGYSSGVEQVRAIYREDTPRIFFAPYEACQGGSPEIHPEHLLLGLLRENEAWQRRLPKTNLPAIRQRVGEHSPQHPKTSTAIDLALSEGAQRVLK
jgi:hypothetical protein